MVGTKRHMMHFTPRPAPPTSGPGISLGATDMDTPPTLTFDKDSCVYEMAEKLAEACMIYKGRLETVTATMGDHSYPDTEVAGGWRVRELHVRVRYVGDDIEMALPLQFTQEIHAAEYYAPAAKAKLAIWSWESDGDDIIVTYVLDEFEEVAA